MRAEQEKTVCQALKSGNHVAKASILKHSGSTPRTSGARMFIFDNDTILGTVGGGLIEAEVIKYARQVLDSKSSAVIRFDLSRDGVANSLDMLCGGCMDVFIELIEANPTNIEVFSNLALSIESNETNLLVTELPSEVGAISLPPKPLIDCDGTFDTIYPSKNGNWHPKRALVLKNGTICGNLMLLEQNKIELLKFVNGKSTQSVHAIEDGKLSVEVNCTPKTVYLFGAGHVSEKVAVLTEFAGFRTIVLDDREQFANRLRFNSADRVIVLTSFNNAFEEHDIDSNSYIIIVTRGHINDQLVLEQALKTKAGYLGMIGSKRKRDAIYENLLKKGFKDSDLERVYSPIGLEIGAETPEEIAISIVSELVKVRAAK